MIGKYLILIFLVLFTQNCRGNDILGCGGFVKSHVNLDFSKIEIGLYTKEGSLKERTECAPTNGYYFLPLYEKGHYVLKVHPPPGWSFEPSQVDLYVDGSTDSCSTGQDINFAFNGFGITGIVITAGQTEGPKGVSVQLIDDKGEKRDTVTGAGGDFHFTPVIPGKYTLKASHRRWKLEPSQAVVQVKEGNTVLPVGVLAVKGYEVKGSVVSDGVHPLRGMYVLLYSKDEKKLKFRVEGCNTALLRDVHENPICHSVTDEEGEFSFGLVPAGEYLLLALEKSPVKPWLTYNLRKVDMSIAVAHDSLYIKKAFQVTGFQVLGSVLTASSGVGMEGVKVELYTDPNQRSKITTATTTNASGQFKLPNVRQGPHWLAFSHDNAEFADYRIDITPDGPPRQPVAVPSKWRVCGSLSPPDQRTVTITSDTDGKSGADAGSIKAVSTGGQWCVFLPPGRYTARVDVTDEEHQSGLRFYPVSQPVAVGRTPVTGIMFSQLKAQLSGKIVCKAPACKNLPVTMRTLAPNGGYTGQPVTIKAKDGKYAFKDVPPGSVEVSVPSSALCWRDSAHNAAVAKETDTAPDFVHTGYAVRLHSHHDVEVEYTHGTKKGTLKVPAGISSHCVEDAGKYVLTPRGCHQFQPVQMEVTVNGEDVETVVIVAVSHAATIRVLSPDPVKDLVLSVSGDGGTKRVGPLPALKQPQGGYAFEHTLYLKDGEVQIVSASSSGLLFEPASPQQVVGQPACQPAALTLRGRRAATVAGNLVPPVEGVVITLSADDVTLTQTTTAEGTYHFGPLDASKQYRVTAEKESYTFGERDAAGNMAAHKLAEITVQLVDEADGTPLQGALVSVSGGTYRRNVVSGVGGAPRFGALAPAQYYVKPHMKEYRFNPPHTLLAVEEGKEHRVTLKGVRVAWSCLGSVVSLAGAPWAAVAVRAEPVSAAADARCAIEEATTEDNGNFRIRGLIPSCVYRLSLKAAGPAAPRLPAAPPTIEVKDKKDIEGIRLIAIQPHQVTDIHVLVKASNLDHYKTLRLTLSAGANQRSSLYATKLDPIGFTAERNPGLLYVMPRLPADNSTYILQLESTLSKVTHHYEEEIHYFEADGTFKSFDIVFAPKVKTSDQELRQTSLLVVPLLALLAIAWSQRNHLFNAATTFATRPQQKTVRPKPEVLDKASIDHIVSAVNAAGKKVGKRKHT